MISLVLSTGCGKKNVKEETERTERRASSADPIDMNAQGIGDKDSPCGNPGWVALPPAHKPDGSTVAAPPGMMEALKGVQPSDDDEDDSDEDDE